MREPTGGHLDGSAVLAALEGADWSDLDGGDGGGVRTLASLRRLATMSDPSPERDEVLGEEVWQDLIHQGTVSAVTARAVPFVLQLAGGAAHPLRRHLLALVAACAHPRDRFADGGIVAIDSHDAARLAVGSLARQLVDLGDADATTRDLAAAALAAATDHRTPAATAVRRWLADRRPTDDDGVVLCFALGLLGDATEDEWEVVARWVAANPEVGLDLVPSTDELSWRHGEQLSWIIEDLEARRRADRP